ncbi:iron permease [Lentinula guzmanii]|uniref:Iron permease n=1 Tax=Lentinula guzmanii TaxID=2804957 RepID=A0AA38MVS4_9AGAR|nr:iron permease [Lentinula guzmanii]
MSTIDPTSAPSKSSQGRGWRFWVIFLALCSSLFLSAIDLVSISLSSFDYAGLIADYQASVSTALPTIIHHLNGTDSFAWVSAAYTLSCTAILPFSGKLADIFGRKATLVSALLFFTIGSAICGAAPTMSALIAGRAVQGIGSGAIQSLVLIIVADLVTLKERGMFISMTGTTWAIASAAGPFLGGAFAQYVTWRWLFYLNLPLCAFALAIVIIFLHLEKPRTEGFWKTLFAMDWIGNFLIIGSSTSVMLALTWAGVSYPWSSTHVIVPLAIGLVGLCVAMVYEVFVVENPTVPKSIFASRTAVAGYVGTFLQGGVLMIVLFYVPAYFQAVKLAKPLLSGIYFLPLMAAISPAAVAQGIIIGKTGNYKLVNLVGWGLMCLGTGLLCLLGPNTSIGVTVPIQIAAAVGIGLIYSTQFVILAPIEPTLNAQALSFMVFLRSFAQSWSVAIGATLLQNQLKHRLPPSFSSTQLSFNADISYTIIQVIPTLSEPLRTQVRTAFAESLVLLWKVCAVVCAAGFLSVFAQQSIALHEKKDARFGMKKMRRGDDSESETTRTDGLVEKDASNGLEAVGTQQDEVEASSNSSSDSELPIIIMPVNNDLDR